MSRECEKLHDKFSGLDRFCDDYWKKQMPDNGIYVVFESGEVAHNTDRIVRIGSHESQGRLPGRIRDHFSPDKDSSIFRKHIGRCLLRARNDPFLKEWNKNHKKLIEAGLEETIDFERLERIEQEISAYITANMSFAVIEAESKPERRLDTESNMIATVARCADCAPSKNWLGLHHPKSKIRNSGLWNIEGVRTNSFDRSWKI